MLRREPAKLPNGRAAGGIKAAAVCDGKTASSMNHATGQRIEGSQVLILFWIDAD
ncbi:MAG: hypothetical protein H0W76_10570 [Pyrinomonadaceae bacterium]|nr:hypothetical protein [Pyrinomonadaceae bacterium]